MAGKLNTLFKIDHSNGALDLSFNSGTLKLGQANLGGRKAVQVIGTSEEAIDTTDIGTLGVFVFVNLDDTNYVDIGKDSSGIQGLIRVLPGEAWPFRAVPGITIKAQAHTAPVKVLVIAYED